MVFAAKPAPARWEGVAVIVWIVLLDLLMVVWALRRPIDLLQFVLFLGVVLSIPVLIHLLYRTWAAFSLEYWIDRNAVTLRWAHLQQIIPMQSVHEIVRGAPWPETPKASLLRWPMPFLDVEAQPSAQSIHLCATRPPSECITLKTETGAYVLSPSDEGGFIEALQERYRLGATQQVRPKRVQRTWLATMLGADRQGLWLLGIGMIGVLLLFAVLTISFPDLPDVLAVRYNSQGLPVEIREKTVLFRLVFIGLLAWAVNAIGGVWLASQRHRTAAHMLWGGAIVVQFFLLLALVSLIA
ncbi:MAG: PH domain-containing protein [Caldilinea sp.]|nr:PH domain-containing protein [Caldilinea sp.]MDW8442205.1 PH domain-containing protein [Caldilineaceae bacterium]